MGNQHPKRNGSRLNKNFIIPIVCSISVAAGSIGFSPAASAITSTETVTVAAPPTPPSEEKLNSLRAQLSSVDRQLSETQNLLVTTNALSSAATAQVRATETRLSQLSDEKATHHDTIANYAKDLYTNGDVSSPQASLATVITSGPTGVTDLTRTEHLRETFGGNEITKVAQLEEDITSEQKTLTDDKAEEQTAKKNDAAAVKKLAELNTARADAVQKLSDETSAYTVLLAKYMCDQERYIQQQNYARALEKAAQEAAAQAAQAQAAQAQAAAQAAQAAAQAAQNPTSSVTPPPVVPSLPSASVPVPASSSPASSSNSVWNAKTMWDILIAEGFSPESIAGILGNLQQESNMNPRIVQSNGVGHGIAQWSAGGRWDTSSPNLLAYAAYTSSDPWSLSTQTQFMLLEMKNRYGGFDIEKYKKMTDVLAATVYFHNVFEQSADSASAISQVRGGYAKEWYAMFKNTVPVISVPVPAPVPTTPSAPATPATPSAPATPSVPSAPATPTQSAPPPAAQATAAGTGDSAIVLSSCPVNS